MLPAVYRLTFNHDKIAEREALEQDLISHSSHAALAALFLKPFRVHGSHS